MILGISEAAYTFIHVLVSLVAIGSGFVFVYGLISEKQLERWMTFFLVTTVLTTLSGFGFPFHGMTPGIIIGILSLLVLAVAIVARYALRLAGAWRWIYVVSATLALYFNVFVLVVQSFEKVPALRALAPTQSEPPFVIVQTAVLAIFVVLMGLAVKRFRVHGRDLTVAA